MPLPRIQAKKATVIPAVAEKVYPDKYIVALGISREPSGKQPCEVLLQAYNYDTKELCESPDAVERFQLSDIWSEAARSTVFAQVMGGLVNVVMLMYQERAAREKVYSLPAGKERDEAITQLHQMQEALGIQPEEIPEPFVETTVWFIPQP